MATDIRGASTGWAGRGRDAERQLGILVADKGLAGSIRPDDGGRAVKGICLGLALLAAAAVGEDGGWRIKRGAARRQGCTFSSRDVVPSSLPPTYFSRSSIQDYGGAGAGVVASSAQRW